MALPIAYFQARRVGDSVARVRELENIRQFLTGSALTLIVDLLFTFVFLAVMFCYLPLLAGVVLTSFSFYDLRGGDAGVSRASTRKFRRGRRTRLSCGVLIFLVLNAASSKYDLPRCEPSLAFVIVDAAC